MEPQNERISSPRGRVTLGDVMIAAGVMNCGVTSEVSSTFRNRMEKGLIEENPEASSSSMAGVRAFESFGLQPEHCSKPTQPFGTSLEDLVNHSWSSQKKAWIWVPKGSVISEKTLGFPATKGEVRRFGARARRIYKIKPRLVDSRSFAEVIGGKYMEKRWGDQNRFSNKRRQDERGIGSWEDREARREEEDLRAKLH